MASPTPDCLFSSQDNTGNNEDIRLQEMCIIIWNTKLSLKCCFKCKIWFNLNPLCYFLFSFLLCHLDTILFFKATQCSVVTYLPLEYSHKDPFTYVFAHFSGTALEIELDEREFRGYDVIDHIQVVLQRYSPDLSPCVALSLGRGLSLF